MFTAATASSNLAATTTRREQSVVAEEPRAQKRSQAAIASRSLPPKRHGRSWVSWLRQEDDPPPKKFASKKSPSPTYTTADAATSTTSQEEAIVAEKPRLALAGKRPRLSAMEPRVEEEQCMDSLNLKYTENRSGLLRDSLSPTFMSPFPAASPAPSGTKPPLSLSADGKKKAEEEEAKKVGIKKAKAKEAEAEKVAKETEAAAKKKAEAEAATAKKKAEEEEEAKKVAMKKAEAEAEKVAKEAEAAAKKKAVEAEAAAAKKKAEEEEEEEEAKNVAMKKAEAEAEKADVPAAAAAPAPKSSRYTKNDQKTKFLGPFLPPRSPRKSVNITRTRSSMKDRATTQASRVDSMTFNNDDSKSGYDATDKGGEDDVDVVPAKKAIHNPHPLVASMPEQIKSSEPTKSEPGLNMFCSVQCKSRKKAEDRVAALEKAREERKQRNEDRDRVQPTKLTSESQEPKPPLSQATVPSVVFADAGSQVSEEFGSEAADEARLSKAPTTKAAATKIKKKTKTKAAAAKAAKAADPDDDPGPETYVGKLKCPRCGFHMVGKTTAIPSSPQQPEDDDDDDDGNELDDKNELDDGNTQDQVINCPRCNRNMQTSKKGHATVPVPTCLPTLADGEVDYSEPWENVPDDAKKACDYVKSIARTHFAQKHNGEYLPPALHLKRALGVKANVEKLRALHGKGIAFNEIAEYDLRTWKRYLKESTEYNLLKTIAYTPEEYVMKTYPIIEAIAESKSK
jgi:hypothetical protein